MKAAALSALILILFPFIQTAPAFAHAFGERYDLPLPLPFYMASAGATVALSFVIMALFFRHTRNENRVAYSFPLPPAATWISNGFKLFSFMIFCLIFLTGFYGVNDALHNFSSVFVWVIWWVGMVFVCAIAGNLWAPLNPWKITFETMQKITRRPLSLHRNYPSWLGSWPAVLFMLFFAWMELISSTGELPRSVACYALIYSAITGLGMFIYGPEKWLKNGEVFSLFFGIVSKFSPIEIKDKRIYLHPIANRLVQTEPVHISVLFFVILVLSIVSLDGFMETPAWVDILRRISESETMRPSLLFLQTQGVDLLQLIKLCALIIAPLIFTSVYFVFSFLMAIGSGSKKERVKTMLMARYFVLSLVPIAIAYHLAHYLSYLLIAGQSIIPLLSDPFGFGWDLFGTAHHKINITVINTKSVWYFSTIAIILGHLYAVYTAHMTALNLCKSLKKAILSQIPMLFLMVGYTMISLWILSQPIVS